MVRADFVRADSMHKKRAAQADGPFENIHPVFM